MKPYGVVYFAICLVNGKVYVGQTTKDLTRYWERRFRSVMRGRGPQVPLNNAIREHGPENFRVFKLVEASCRRELDDLERRFIKQFRATDGKVGYNVCSSAVDMVAMARARVRSWTPEQWSAMSRKAWAGTTPEQRSKILRKRWAKARAVSSQ